MKKILSVALSTAMAFSMFASVAFGADTNLTPQQKFDVLKQASIMDGMPDGSAALEKTLTRAELAKIIVKSVGLEEVNATSYNDKNYSIHWARTFIEAATQAGILEGTDAAKKLFNPSGNVTVQELAAVLVRALKLEVPTETNNNASEWAKGYVEAAVKAGFLDSAANFTANATRSQAIVAAYAIYEAGQVPTVKSYEVKDSKNVEFTLSTDEVVKVTLEKALEANKETEVTFKTAAGEEIQTKVTWVLTTATKIDTVNATNLKDFDLAFDGKVDETTATNKENYTLKNGSVDSVSLLEDGITVRVVVKDSLANQKANTVTVKNVKAGDRVISGEKEFTPIDNTLPSVVEVKSLGTKALKVVFSEPIAKTISSNFKIDGKTFYGSVTEGSREVILTPYDSTTLAVGDHKLTVAGVEDYFKLKALSSDHDFTVVEDKEAPTVAKTEATLEVVKLTFSEEVDPSTVVAGNIYWKSGDVKKKASSVKKLASDKYEVEFTSDNRLPSWETSLFVEDVKDYSGNKITVTEVKVTAVVDQVRPEVVDVTSNTDTPKEIKVTFSKAVDAADRKHFTVKNKDGDVLSIREVKKAEGSTNNRVFIIVLYSDLPSGTNTLKVSGVADLTALKNVLIDYTTDVKVGDVTGPKLLSVSANSATRTIEIAFDEKLDSASAANKDNYRIVLNNVERALPDDTELTPVRDGKSVRIILPEKVGNTTVTFPRDGAAGTVEYVVVAGVKDVAGNVLQGWTQKQSVAETKAATKAYDNDITQHAILDAKDTIKVRFNQPITAVSASDFVLSSGTIYSASADGDLVTIKTSDLGTVPTITLTLKADNAVKAGNGNSVVGEANITIKDKVKPEVSVKDNTTLSVSGQTIYLPFTEALEAGPAAYYANDLVVTRVSDNNKKLNLNEYTTTVSGSQLLITINDGKTGAQEYTVKVVKDATLLKDVSGNVAVESGSYNAYINGTIVNPTDVITNQAAKHDGFMMTNVTADLKADVTSVVLYKDGVKIQEPSIANGKLNTDLLGASKGDVLTIEAYAGSAKVGSVNVTVQ